MFGGQGNDKPLASKTTAASDADNEDVFRYIESGDVAALKKLLSHSKGSNINRSTMTGEQETSSNNDSEPQPKITCMRNNRHFSALLFACYSNQQACL